MIRCVFLLFVVVFCQIRASEEAQIKEQLKNHEIETLQGEDHFLVYYAFEELDKPLKDVMVTYLKKLGTVYFGDVSKLSEKEKEARIKPGPVIQIVFSSLIEEKSYSSVEHVKLPVMELSFQVMAGSQILKTGQKQECSLWKQEKFLSTKSKEFKEKSIKIFESIMDQFIRDYQKVNKSSEVCFYLYS